MLRLSELSHEELEIFYNCINEEKYTQAMKVIRCEDFEAEETRGALPDNDYSAIPTCDRWVLDCNKNCGLFDSYFGIRLAVYSLDTKEWVLGVAELSEYLNKPKHSVLSYMEYHPENFRIFRVTPVYTYKGVLGDLLTLSKLNKCTKNQLRGRSALKKVGYRLDENDL